MSSRARNKEQTQCYSFVPGAKFGGGGLTLRPSPLFTPGITMYLFYSKLGGSQG
jgi:hypothetical protein